MFIFLTFFPLFLFAQSTVDFRSFVPIGFKIKSIMDSTNYIETKPRLAILDYLHLNKLNPENYFIDSVVNTSGDTLYIHVWDISGLQAIKRYERNRDSVNK